MHSIDLKLVIFGYHFCEDRMSAKRNKTIIYGLATT